MVSGAGCLAPEASIVQGAPLRVGDNVTYEVQKSFANGNSVTSTFSMRVGAVETTPEGAVGASDVFSVAFRSARADNYTTRGTFYVSTSGNLMVRSIVECARFADWNCSREEQVFADPQPWGFGSSFFQGRLVPGFMPWHSDGHDTILAVSSDDASVTIGQADGDHLVPMDQHSWATGRFVVTSDSPFVEQAETSYRLWSDLLERYVGADVVATQIEFVRGQGPTIVIADTMPPRMACVDPAGPFVSGLPPGANEAVHPITATLGEFVAAARADQAIVDDALSVPGAYAPIVWVSNPASPSSESPFQVPPSGGQLFTETETNGQVAVHRDDLLHVYEVTRTRSSSATGTTTSYDTAEFATRAVAYPSTYTRQVVSIAEVLGNHFDAEGQPAPEGLRLMVFQMDWGRSTVVPTLKMIYGSHAGPEYTYDLLSGCLVHSVQR